MQPSVHWPLLKRKTPQPIPLKLFRSLFQGHFFGGGWPHRVVTSDDPVLRSRWPTFLPPAEKERKDWRVFDLISVFVFLFFFFLFLSSLSTSIFQIFFFLSLSLSFFLPSPFWPGQGSDGGGGFAILGSAGSLISSSSLPLPPNPPLFHIGLFPSWLEKIRFQLKIAISECNALPPESCRNQCQQLTQHRLQSTLLTLNQSDSRLTAAPDVHIP